MYRGMSPLAKLSVPAKSRTKTVVTKSSFTKHDTASLVAAAGSNEPNVMLCYRRWLHNIAGHDAGRRVRIATCFNVFQYFHLSMVSKSSLAPCRTVCNHTRAISSCFPLLLVDHLRSAACVRLSIFCFHVSVSFHPLHARNFCDIVGSFYKIRGCTSTVGGRRTSIRLQRVAVELAKVGV